MKVYRLPKDAPISTIDDITLTEIDCRQWEVGFSTREAVFGGYDYLETENLKTKVSTTFPYILNEFVSKNPNYIVLRTYHRGKVFYAKVNKAYLTVTFK